MSSPALEGRNETMKFRNPQDAFENAIKTGALSDNPKNDNYAGHWMYMGTEPDGTDLAEVRISNKE